MDPTPRCPSGAPAPGGLFTTRDHALGAGSEAPCVHREWLPAVTPHPLRANQDLATAEIAAEPISTLEDYEGPIRQLTIAGLGHEGPTLLLTNQLTRPARELIRRYAQRMVIENSIAGGIGFFHMDALSPAVAMKVDCGETLSSAGGIAPQTADLRRTTRTAGRKESRSGGLAPQHDLRAAQMGLQFVERAFYLPALMIESRRLPGRRLAVIEDRGDQARDRCGSGRSRPEGACRTPGACSSSPATADPRPSPEPAARARSRRTAGRPGKASLCAGPAEPAWPA